MNSSALQNKERSLLAYQIALLLSGIALAVFAADMNFWMLLGIGPAAVQTWKHDLGLPFELLWIFALFIIGLVSGLLARLTKIRRRQVLFLLAGPFAVSAFVGGLLAVFMFGQYSGPLEAAFMLLYPVALAVGVFLGAKATSTTQSAA